MAFLDHINLANAVFDENTLSTFSCEKMFRFSPITHPLNYQHSFVSWGRKDPCSNLGHDAPRMSVRLTLFWPGLYCKYTLRYFAYYEALWHIQMKLQPKQFWTNMSQSP